MIPKYSPSFTLTDALCSRPSRMAIPECEKNLAAYCGVRHAILFRSGREALFALLKALGSGGEVVLPAYNCIAVPDAVAGAGCLPRLADIAQDSVNMSLAGVKSVITDRTRAVILTHQFGIPADVAAIVEYCRDRNVFVIEDGAAAFGARYKGRLVGSFGDAAILSFQFTKVINAGRCGAMLTSDDGLAAKVRRGQHPAEHVAALKDWCLATAWAVAMRRPVYGVLRRIRQWCFEDPDYEKVHASPLPPKVSAVCSQYVAGLLRRQLSRVADILLAREALCRLYAHELRDVAGIRLCEVPPEASPAWMQFPVFTDDKWGAYRYCLAQGVDLSWTFRYCCSDAYPGLPTPNAMQAARSVLGLPTYPGLAAEDVRHICKLLRNYFRER